MTKINRRSFLQVTALAGGGFMLGLYPKAAAALAQPVGEDVANAAHRSSLDQIQQLADRPGRTRLATDFARDCKRGVHGDGRTHPHDADDKAGL